MATKTHKIRRVKEPDSFSSRVPIMLPIVGMMFGALFICLKVTVLPENFNRFIKFMAIWFIMMLHVVPMMKAHKWMAIAPVYAVLTTAATIIAGQTFENIAYAVMSGFGLWALLVGFYAQAERFGKEVFSKHVFWCFFVFSLLNDVSILLSHSHGSHETYLLGSKFTAGYLHILLLALYLYLINKRRGAALYNRFLFLALFLESVLVLAIADSLTCLLAVLFLFALSFLPKKFMARFSVGWVLVAIAFLVTILFFGSLMLLKNPVVANFVQTILRRSLSLTGRTQIYEALNDLVQASPIYGYGYGNDIVRDIVGWGNAQNGIGSLMITYGFMGTIPFFALVCFLLPRRPEDLACARSIGCCFLSFILTSLVEISFGSVFCLALLVFSALGFSREPEEAAKVRSIFPPKEEGAEAAADEAEPAPAPAPEPTPESLPELTALYAFEPEYDPEYNYEYEARHDARTGAFMEKMRRSALGDDDFEDSEILPPDFSLDFVDYRIVPPEKKGK